MTFALRTEPNYLWQSTQDPKKKHLQRDGITLWPPGSNKPVLLGEQIRIGICRGRLGKHMVRQQLGLDVIRPLEEMCVLFPMRC